ncbi:DUF4255 domain-containing protein [Vibrio sp. EA2]|uniref:DUF4255 domain-containing protein n=1 Tax=Vibrio sp. EA2 TaxID=3079860 RepID=UPI00294A0A24|nr:DUF4255 domain-containing protein [Vibrio sp. EA2]MDV6250473.1 DUF4255 domain-containing protein [Vibrio sp. EA2]
MPIADSSLYLICNSVADFIRSGLQTFDNDINVYLGSPANLTERRDEDRINLFFYRFEPSGFQANAHPHLPWHLRLHCMITSMAIDDDNTHPGEDDLRLLGQVLMLFHEHRVQPMLMVNDMPFRLNAVFNPASDEQLNQLWSIQGDASYRPSALFEMSLAPIQPEELKGEAPLVGFTGSQVAGAFDSRFDDFNGSISTPIFSGGSVNPNNPAWTPMICWVEGEECVTSLSLDVENTLPGDFHPQLWVAGRIGESVSLEWKVWQGDNWVTESGVDLVVSSATISPETIPLTLPTLDLPELAVDGDHDRWQLIVTTNRSYQAYADGPSTLFKSNPLIISLYRGSTA